MVTMDWQLLPTLLLFHRRVHKIKAEIQLCSLVRQIARPKHRHSIRSRLRKLVGECNLVSLVWRYQRRKVTKMEITINITQPRKPRLISPSTPSSTENGAKPLVAMS